jgi:UDP-N-acetylglucosamine:LPS N-acetylglucosamine transferase
VVEQSFGGTRGHISKNVCLAEEFNAYLRNAITDLETKTAEQLHSEVLLLFVKVSALYVLNFNLFGTTDKKLFRQLWELTRKVIVCYTSDFAIYFSLV